MKYIVGYPVKNNQNFINSIIDNKKSVEEVYFSWGDMPNGRSSVNGDAKFEALKRQDQDLRRISKEGVKLNMLFNANCYGKNSQSRAFFNEIGDLTDYVKSEYGLYSVTTSSPLIAKFMKENFADVSVRASVNMEIGSVDGILYLSKYFDSFYVKREANRNLQELKKLRKWCDDNGKEMYLLANSGCLNNCSAHIFHDNLVAHEAEISTMDNGYQFNGICWEFLSDKENANKWLQRTNFIRPEDVYLYEGLVPAMKLATRVNSAPCRVLKGYVENRYRGSVMELLEPNHSGLFYPEYIENSKFKKDFATFVMNCDKNCEKCSFCAQVMKDACVKLSDDTSAKV